MKRETTVIAPRAPHPATLTSGNYSIVSSDGTRLVCWCPRHQCGAVFHFEAQIWAMQMPVSFAEFLQALRTANIIVDSTDDLTRWIENCTAAACFKPGAPAGMC